MTRTSVAPALLESAIACAHRDHEQLHVVIPAVIPPTLPISAMPDRLAERVNALRRAAIGAFARHRARGRIEVVPSRDARSALLAAVVDVPDHVLLVGAPGRSLRRAAEGLAAVVVIAEIERDAPLRAAGRFSESVEPGAPRLRRMSFHSRDQARALPETERGLPRPGHALAPYGAILVAAGLFEVGHALPLRSAVALAAAAALAGAAVAGWTWAQRARLRDMADRFIAAGEGDAPSAAVLTQRRAELVSLRERRTLAAAVRRAVTTAQTPPRRSAQVPIDVRSVRAERPRLEQLADVLGDTDVPVSARGVALTHVLVTDPASPLYGRSPVGAEELHRHLVRTLFELEAGRR